MRISREEPFPLVTVETLGLWLAKFPHPVHLTAQGAPFPSRRPAVAAAGGAAPGWAAAVHPGWDWGRLVVEGGRREGCLGGHPVRLLQIWVRLTLQETP